MGIERQIHIDLIMPRRRAETVPTALRTNQSGVIVHP